MSNELVPVTYNNERILTTKQLAQVYETSTDIINQNFSRNSNRFIEGKHYFKLEGEKLKAFKSEPSIRRIVKSNVNKLYLWTERGADRHCKILDNDKAWEQFDHLEETYFRVKESKIQIQNFDNKLENLQLEQQGLKLAVDLLKPSKASTVRMLKDFNNSQGLSTAYLPDYVDDKVGFSATALLQKFNVPMNVRQFNTLMIEHGFLEKRTRPSTGKRKFKSYNHIMDKGLKYGKNEVSTKGSASQSQPLYYEDTFIELVNILAPLKEVI
ncbi:ORF6N domain-containing protein [Clostridium kluyveri]|uniref:Phage-related protein n=2 Tax=Clostridium kluyveri TaxID=1534 RepID=A5N2B5_CLOK5|nr:ORF6N domain-containing protein [Clostridium kluyveri]EDK35261.1 Phage-related protein [Clostridium kluyveri DSM 555]BAH07934.1 hypothetical protein CKR_2883 [Clostridium kluyveri NBRC 12016]